MGKLDFERDTDLRGYWVEGLQELQPVALSAMAYKPAYQKQIFIPDRLLRELGWSKEGKLEVKGG